MSLLERILRELESATALAASQAGDLDALKQFLDRRQRALTSLGELAGSLQSLPLTEREDAVCRLRLIGEASVWAEGRIATLRGDVMAEWTQWSRIYRALGAASAGKSGFVDYRG